MVSSRPQMDLGTLPPLTQPYLDSSVFVAHVKKELNVSRGTTRFDITTQILKGAEDGKYKIYTSFLSIAEVRRLKEKTEQLTSEELPVINDLFRRFMEHEWIMPVEVNRTIAEKAQELGATYRWILPSTPQPGRRRKKSEEAKPEIYSLSPTDAIHVASAIITKCNVLMAWDKRLVSLFRETPIEGVTIIEPYWEGIPLMTPVKG